ncbi:MAG: hypothetical protein GTO18_10545 [Anaerolineales bacterium]|nr:hypothetical protein [Anaerolineales bacterium]
MKQPQVLIIAKEKSLSEGIASLLISLPSVGNVGLARGHAEALLWAETNEPDLVILDMSTCTLDLLEEIRSRHPDMKNLVLVDGMREQTRAQVAGADVALITGYPADDLFKTVKALVAFDIPGKETED